MKICYSLIIIAYAIISLFNYVFSDEVHTIENIRPFDNEDIILRFVSANDSMSWRDTIIAHPGDTCAVDVFIQMDSSAWAGNCRIVLGADVNYFAEIVESSCVMYNPFLLWDNKSFKGYTTYEDIHSLTFDGTAYVGGPPNPWLHYVIPQRVLTFYLISNPDTSLIGYTYCDILMEGRDPDPYTPEGHHAMDTTGLDSLTIAASYACIRFTSAGFILNPPPNELDVSISTDITITFDTEMDPLTINDSSFIVNTRSGGPVSGSIDYDGFYNVATFNPSDDFDWGETCYQPGLLPMFKLLWDHL